MAIATTVYFRGKWSDEFAKRNTSPDVFHATTGDVTRDFMRQRTTGNYYWGERHAARVSIDEEGCEAVAYTVLAGDNTTGLPPDDEVDFTLDRPFLFAIEGPDRLPLFAGVVNQP